MRKPNTGRTAYKTLRHTHKFGHHGLGGNRTIKGDIISSIERSDSEKGQTLKTAHQMVTSTWNGRLVN